MRRFSLAGLVLLGLPLLAGVAAPVHSDAPRPRVSRPPLQRPDRIPGQWVVRLRSAVAPAAAARLHAQSGARILGTIGATRTQLLALPDASVATYRRSALVEWIEPNRPRFPLVVVPNDPAYNELDLNLAPDDPTWFEWDARKISAHEAWSIWPNRYLTAQNPGQNRVRMAVIDTGVDEGHDDFINAGGSSPNSAQGGQLDVGLDVSIFNGQQTPGAMDEYGHGTHVAGIAGAATHNSLGVTGNGYNATILSIKVLDAQGQGSSFDVALGIAYAADHGCLIINMSIGDYTYSQAEQDAVTYAWNRGTLCIAAAGNDGSGTLTNYPAGLSRVLAVCATSEQDSLATYSNFGDYVGLGAPGGDLDFNRLAIMGIYSTLPEYFVTLNDPNVQGSNLNHDYLIGTSMASPQVAGLAALFAGQQGITQATPNAPLRIYQALQRSCDDIVGTGGNWTPIYGFGRINMAAALSLNNVPNPRDATAGCVTGQVMFQGTPVANASVRATPVGGGTAIQGSSRADGCYRVINAPAGNYNVTASVFGQNATVNNVTITAGCDLPGIDFNVGGGGGTGPNAPSGLQVSTVSSTSLQVQWSDNATDEQGFRLERRTSPGSFTEISSLGPNTTSTTDNGLTANTTYTYRVRAYNGAGNSGYSNEASGTTAGGGGGLPPNAPTGLTATAVTGSQINLGWTDQSQDEENFRLERKVGSAGSWQTLIHVGANVTTFADTGLTAGTTYFYRARSVNANGASDPSNEASATPQNTGGASITVTAPNTAVTWSMGARAMITWNSTGVTGNVTVALSLDGGASWQTLAAVPNTGSHEWTVLCMPTTRALVRVTSISQAGVGDQSDTPFTIADAQGGTLSVASSVNFGNVRARRTKKVSLRLRNTHTTQSLRVTVIDPSVPFGVEGTVRTMVIPARGRATLKLWFTPSARGAASQTLQLATSDPNAQSREISLTGKGT